MRIDAWDLIPAIMCAAILAATSIFSPIRVFDVCCMVSYVIGVFVGRRLSHPNNQ